MKYRIDSTYCWYRDWENKNPKIVLMYYINGVPFTYDELEDVVETETDIKRAKVIADNEVRYNIEELYNHYSYLMEEECHPLMFELELENPKDLPDELSSYIEEDLME